MIAIMLYEIARSIRAHFWNTAPHECTFSFVMLDTRDFFTASFCPHRRQVVFLDTKTTPKPCFPSDTDITRSSFHNIESVFKISAYKSAEIRDQCRKSPRTHFFSHQAFSFSTERERQQSFCKARKNVFHLAWVENPSSDRSLTGRIHLAIVYSAFWNLRSVCNSSRWSGVNEWYLG